MEPSFWTDWVVAQTTEASTNSPSDYTGWLVATTSDPLSAYWFYDNGTTWVDVSDSVYIDTGTEFVRA